MQKKIQAIKEYLSKDYRLMYRPSGGILNHKFLTPGACYSDCLWDWDSYFADVALRQILLENGEDTKEASEYEKGGILNFLEHTNDDGFMPIMITRDMTDEGMIPVKYPNENMHKPVIAQHAAFLVKQENGNAHWLAPYFDKLRKFINCYLTRHTHTPTGLVFWQTDNMIGVDNDPCTFYRPDGSSASIFLNCLMVKELSAMAYLATCLGREEDVAYYIKEHERLATAVREHCYDERDGFFYSVDINLRPVDSSEWLHSGAPRNWDCLIQRIDSWSGFAALWAGVATREQAERIATRFDEEQTFNCAGGIRTLSKLEKMYQVVASGNPSCWLGPVWIISNYLTFRGLLCYGFTERARELCEKTINLLGEDVIKNGCMHEYYNPDTCEPVINAGFLNWNMLVLNMAAWYEGRDFIEEF